MVAQSTLARRLAALLLVAGTALTACAPQPPPSTGVEPTEAAAPTAQPATAAPANTAPPPPTAAPTDAPTSPPEPTAAPTQAPTAAPTEAPAAAVVLPSELLFLREGALIALDPASGAERRIADGVSDFAATPDGALLALVREADLWLVARDGSGLRNLSGDGSALIEATPSWTPDGLTVVYAASKSGEPYPNQWLAWAPWCGASEVRKVDLPAGAISTLAPGCDPAVSPDGRRIAYASPPTAPVPGMDSGMRLSVNSVRLINRQGQNGWDFARAAGPGAGSASDGVLVYAPAWSPDGAQVAYQRYVGMQVETDVNMSEVGGSLKGQGQPFASGAGWLMPPLFAPDGRTVVVTEHTYGDARGFGGYDAWAARAVRLEGTRPVAMPSGEVTMLGTELGGRFPRAQRAVWSPDGSALAVQLPPNWRPGLPDDEPLDPGGLERLGELWRWQPGSDPAERIAVDVSFASPLAWLPATAAHAAGGYRLVAPAGWQLAAPGEFEERTAVAPDGIRLVSAAPYAQLAAADLAAQSAAQMFPSFVAGGGKDEAAIVWPDGSVYREFSGAAPDGTPVAGATRVVRRADGSTVALLYRSTAGRWPLDRALAQALLARSGPVS